MPSPTDATVSELPAGEKSYRMFHEQLLKEHPPQGNVEELERLVSMIQTYCIDDAPANEKGQVTFQRAVFDSIKACLVVTIQKMKHLTTVRDSAWLNLLELSEAMGRLERNEYPYLARGSQGRVWMHHQKSADYRLAHEQLTKLLECLS